MHAAIRTSFVHTRIAEQIGSSILSGRRAVGSLLPKEMDATASLGVSRPKVGTHVTHRRRWQVLDPDVLRWAFHSGPSVTFIHELFELREILEPHAAELAARRRNTEQLALMGHALGRWRDMDWQPLKVGLRISASMKRFWSQQAITR
jgi:DNA-binding FadR family transcriptional regulator